MSGKYKVENDEYYKTFISKPSRNENTAKKYKRILNKFYKSTGKTIGEIITICIDEQNIVTTVKLSPDANGNERRREIKFDINNKDASINKFFNQYEKYCKERNNKNTTINAEKDLLRTFLGEFGVIMPKREILENDADDWYLPTKEDFNYIAQDLTLIHTALLNFLTSTGMRIGDALSITVGGFMKATSDYHDYVNVDDFIDNAPEDMIGQWIFTPTKTRRHGIKCITFNSTHSSNLILQSLRHLKNQYMPKKNKEDKELNLKITKKSPLFPSRYQQYQTPILPKSVSDKWTIKNKKFREWKISQINQKIEDGELSPEDFDEEVSKIPKFHAHVCRKFFCTTVSNNCGDIRVCAYLEGHSDGLPNDPSYIKKNAKDIKDIYVTKIHDALCLSKVETRIVTTKETEELHEKIGLLEDQLEEKDEQHRKDSDKIERLKEQLEQQGQKIEETQETLKLITKEKTYNSLFNSINNYIINNHIYNDPDEEELVVLLATEYAVEHKDEFDYTNNYIERIIRRVRLQIEIDGRPIKEQLISYFGTSGAGMELQINIQIVLDKIWSSEKIMDILGDSVDLMKLEDLIENELSKYNKDLSDEDVDNIILDVAMQY